MANVRPIAALLIAAGLTLSSAGAAGAGGAPPVPVAAVDSVVYGDWIDPAREGRKVPYKLYLPQGAGPFPVIVHSHGLGGSREGSSYILDAVAKAGFVVVAVQHGGSDTSILSGPERGREGLLLGKMGPDAAVKRFGDVPFTLDQLAVMNAPGASLAGKLDLSRVGMSGHSFGALTTLAAVGQVLPGAPAEAFREPRIKAAVVYSPNKARQGGSETAFSAIRTPMLHFTGTEDSTPLDLEETPWERTIPFQRIDGADQFLIVLHGGDHSIFAGRRQTAGMPRPNDAKLTPLIVDETVIFWRAYLGGDAQAARALCRIPVAVQPLADGYTKAARCGHPTPIKPAE
ncbi:MAG: dienelactone hydrolase [Pseudomonadota bacterium]|uniref:alpha/beta hydrolase family protein n=1 Tax=unclassified Phenylobacterium TaxID=2640670 RepID=UPI0006F223BA|nr:MULTISPECIES: hypothetical protein [unclassified Phenylobacterium]KRB52621.1 hypothetical protein ASE02_11590 [Phenylobacterium sp. Root700]MBT9471970.1 dienelactone hydrolase [Phenylobacterium sp.]